MSSNTPQGRISITIDDGDPIIVDADGDPDGVCRALADERRRQVLCVLKRESMPIDVRTLARQVTIQEACDDSKLVTKESITQTQTTLYHNHLPKMADLDLIEYDPEESVEGIAGTIDSVRL
jgi:hypothetical protein